ncbi:MAG: twin-arginine translocase subunit TatC [Dehalococcoidia bacterium]
MSNDEKLLTFTGHLAELRRRLIRSVIAIVIATIISLIFARHIFNFLISRAPEDTDFVFIEMTEMFGTYVQVALTAGIVLVMPFLVYQLLMFVSPALTGREKKYVYIALPWISIMFLGGVAFAYFLLVPPATRFFIGFGGDIAEAQIRIGNYVGLVTKLMVAIGLVFEAPVIITFLARLGVVTPQWLASKRRWAIVGAFILAAVTTPPDPVTQILLAGPVILLFEVSIFTAKIAYSRKMKADRSSDYLA